MDRSVATPSTSPRLPFINVPVAGVLLSLMICHSGVLRWIAERWRVAVGAHSGA
jgi:hypothetical protein